MSTNFKKRRYENPEYRAWVKTRRCLVQGCHKKTDPHHWITRGAGGDDKDCIPLCAGLDGHHTQIHQIGRWTFSDRYGLDLKEAASDLFREYIMEVGE
jgi:hypothetical protein